MTRKVVFFSLLIALAGFVALQLPTEVRAQDGAADDDVRGAFLTSRPKAAPKGTAKTTPGSKPSRRRPKPTPPKAGDGTTSGGTTSGGTTSGGASTGGKPEAVNVSRIGMGLTLFMRDSNGLAVRTDPTREFRKGDHVRFLIETNADGYLYVFNTTDGGQPVMVYPDPELDDAGNYFQAHVPFEIPSSVAPEERLRWLTFDAHPGAERLYFVFTREPLSSVPIEDDLITYCRDNSGKCPWHPGTDVWAQVQNELNEPVKVAKVQGVGNAQTSAEHSAATRGIGLNRDDPEPSLVMLSATTSKNMLVAAVDLIHKAASLAASSDDAEQ
jgi:hypothetical protein